jgi:hypothetical protein
VTGDAVGDCDDSVATVYSGAAEICDGLDNDCDGSADEYINLNYYIDNDSDTYSSGSTATGTQCIESILAHWTFDNT